MNINVPARAPAGGVIFGGYGNFGKWDLIGEDGSLGVGILGYSILDHSPPHFLLPVHSDVHHCPSEHTPAAIIFVLVYGAKQLCTNLLKRWAKISYSCKVFPSGIWLQQ